MSQTIEISMGEGVAVASYDAWMLNRLQWLRACEHLSEAQCCVVLDAVATRLAASMALDLLAAADKITDATLDVRCAIPASLS